MFKKILFCTDFSENSHYAFSYALDLTKTYKSKLLILHVVPEPAHPELLSIYLSPEKLEELRISQRKELEDQLKQHYLSKMGRFKDYAVIIKQGEAFDEIIQTAKKEKVDLIVMGTQGRTGLDYILFGSTAEKVVRNSPYPVMTIRLPGKKFTMP